jgi:hypothetical protein
MLSSPLRLSVVIPVLDLEIMSASRKAALFAGAEWVFKHSLEQNEQASSLFERVISPYQAVTCGQTQPLSTSDKRVSAATQGLDEAAEHPS